MATKVYNLTDFRGGYAVSLPPEKTPNNVTKVAENCWWVDGPVKRQGHDQHSDLSSYSNCLGFHRVYANSTWNTILALDNGSNVNFYQTSSNVPVLIDSGVDFSQGYGVEFADIREKVVAVNGQNRAAVIYYDSGWKVKPLDEYDERTRTDETWQAGLYDDSGASNEGWYVDDTTDAQDAGASDVVIASSGVNNDGLWVACDYTFSRLKLTNAQQFTGAPVAAYEYYNGSAWAAFTPTSAPVWTAATGDKYLGFDYIPAWGVFNEAPDRLKDRFMIRVRFTTAPTNSPTVNRINVYHRHVLSEITGDAKPQATGVHANSLWLAAGNYVNWSVPNDVTGWKFTNAEYFLGGGRRIEALVSHGEYLAVIKDGSIHGFFGNQFADAVKRKIADTGTVSGRSVKVVNNEIYFLSTDGIYGWNGQQLKRLSKHIQSDIDGYTLTDAAAVEFKGHYLLSFPTNSIILLFDPDTYREVDLGEGRVSFWKWKYGVSQFCWFHGAGDTDELIGLDNTNAKLIHCQNGNYYDDASTAIDMVLRTKNHSFDNFQQEKIIKRVKPQITASDSWTLTMYADNAARNASATIASGSGLGYYADDIDPPYDIDGKDLSLYLRNNTTKLARIYGFAVEVERRKY